MRRWWWMLVLAVAAGTAPAGSQREPLQAPKMVQKYGIGRLVAGNWLIELSGATSVVPATGPITGFGFGPGRHELAYCASAGAEDRSGLWVIAVSVPEGWAFPVPEIDARRRLVWTAPPGLTLKGPIRWAPDGSKIALRACGEDTADLAVVEYLGGGPVWVTEGAQVIEAAWAQGARQIAYVAETGEARSVWVQTSPPEGSPRRLGNGGFDLRWSLEGDKLRWLRPKSEAIWAEMTWDAEKGGVAETAGRPPRPRDAQWSPDGQACAALEPVDETGEKQLVLYARGSTAGDVVPLPEAHPDQLLGWSPDSALVMVLGESDHLLAVTARPAAAGAVLALAVREGGPGRAVPLETERASLLGWPITNAEAGQPAWSSDGRLLAYVVGAKETVKKAYPRFPEEGPYGKLIVERMRRRYVRPLRLTDNAEIGQVVSNMKNVALALQMYLADNNDIFPPTADSDEVWWILDEYVRDRSVFRRPGTEDEVVVQYLVPPGLRLVEVQDPVGMPAAVVDYHPDFFVIAYGDGHVKMFEKEGEYWETWEAWWREFWERREREGS